MIYFISYIVIGVIVTIIFFIDHAKTHGRLTVKDVVDPLLCGIFWPLTLLIVFKYWWDTVDLAEIGNRVIWQRKGGAK